MPPDPIELPIHPFLRERLKSSFGGNLSRMGDACDASPSMVSKWVSEDPRRQAVPGPTSCRKIAAGLYLDPDYVLELAGHRQASADRPSTNPVQSELTARLTRLGETLSRYPRGFWLAVVEASERMADAGEAIQPEGGVSSPQEDGVITPFNPPKRGDHGSKGPLANAFQAASAALV